MQMHGFLLVSSGVQAQIKYLLFVIIIYNVIYVIYHLCYILFVVITRGRKENCE